MQYFNSSFHAVSLLREWIFCTEADWEVLLVIVGR